MKDFYRARLQEGYKMHEIDQMDIDYFIELTQATIDHVTADEIDWL